MSEITVFFLLFFGIIVFAVVMVAAVSRSARSWLKPKESPEKTGITKGANLIWSAYHTLAMLAAVAGGLKYVYRAWKSAAPGSTEQLGWGTLLALVVALGLWIAVVLLDNALNRDRDMARNTSEPSRGF